MNISFGRARCRALVVAALAAIVMPQFARGEEGQAPAPSQNLQAVPLLAKVPYFNRLFKNVGCEDGSCKQEEVERIGIDFQILGDGEFPFAVKFWECGTGCEGGQCKTKACCEGGECRVNVAACECPGTKVSCQSCPVAVKSSCACGTKCACDSKCGCGEACQCGDHVIAHPFGPVPFIAHHLPPHAVIAHHGPPHPAGGCPAMFEHLLELTAKSAALEAKLEARNEQAELVSEMLELAQENAQLKAQIDLAEAKAEMSQHVLAVTLENEQLKARLVELTSKLESENVRTAKPWVQHPAPR